MIGEVDCWLLELRWASTDGYQSHLYTQTSLTAKATIGQFAPKMRPYVEIATCSQLEEIRIDIAAKRRKNVKIL